MDVNIDTEAITEGLESISNTISSIENCVNFITTKVEMAAEDFTSVNFFRASDNVQTANQILNEMMAKLETTKTYLNTLVDYIEKYNNLKF